MCIAGVVCGAAGCGGGGGVVAVDPLGCAWIECELARRKNGIADGVRRCFELLCALNADVVWLLALEPASLRLGTRSGALADPPDLTDDVAWGDAGPVCSDVRGGDASDFSIGVHDSLRRGLCVSTACQFSDSLLPPTAAGTPLIERSSDECAVFRLVLLVRGESGDLDACSLSSLCLSFSWDPSFRLRAFEKLHFLVGVFAGGAKFLAGLARLVRIDSGG